MKLILSLILVLVVSGCAMYQKGSQTIGYEPNMPKVAPNKLQKEFDSLPPPDGKKVSVAVYQFIDKTGQRRQQPGVASFSTAVTQGADVFLIKALQDVGQGQWFDVVERGNIDALTKERLIIRQMREAYEGKDAKALMPMMFAGIIMEGGIIGYDSGTESGGAAYRFLGIGPQTQYSKDIVTISLRALSVNTGKILAAVTVTKIVYSTADSFAVLKYIDNSNIVPQIFGGAKTGTLTSSIFEAETGLTINEPGTLAVKATVEAAVVELIKEGERKGVWDYRKAMVQVPPDATPVTDATVPIIKNEMPAVSPAVQVVPTTPAAAEKIGLDPNIARER
jgi:curli production assembly/transport component CsgG